MKVLVQESLEAIRNWENLSELWVGGLGAASEALELQFEDLELAINPVSLIDSSGKAMSELEAGRRLYSALSFPSTLQSTDERIWVSLTLQDYWEYFQLRWPVGRNPSKQDVEKILQNHLFCYNNRMRFRDHPLSSLWWRQRYILKTVSGIAPKAEKLLFDFNSDFPVQFLGRPNIASQVPVAMAFLDFIYKLFVEDGRKYDRLLVRNLLKQLDLSGGYKIASSLSPEDAVELVQNQFLAASGATSSLDSEF